MDNRSPLTEIPTAIESPMSEVMSRLRKYAQGPRPTPERQEAYRVEWEARYREQRALEAVVSLARSLGPRYRPERASLDTFQVYHKAQAPILERVRALIKRLPAFVAEGGGIVAYGSVGTGKDHLLAALLYEAARHGVSCRWINGQEVYGQLRDRMDTDQREEDLFGDLCRPQVLAISDPVPPVGMPTAWNVAQLYRLLDRRYRSLSSTWMSLNAISPDDVDQTLSAPVFDRLRDGAEMLPCLWPTYRKECKP